jgi:hypothetical protein
MVRGRVAAQGVDGGQPCVAGAASGAPFGLEVVEEDVHTIGVEVFEAQLGWGDAGGRLHGAEERTISTMRRPSR